MLTLLSTLALAGTPTLSCETVEVPIPAEDESAGRPKGFQWEGFRPVGVLADGRAVLVRGSALEGLSRRDLKRQHENDGPDRVMQVVLVKPSGKADTIATVPRGTLLEIAATPSGGMLVARTTDATSGIDLVEASGRVAGTTRTPDNPQADKIWRRENPLRGTGPTRLAPLSEDRVVVWHAGAAVVLDLRDHAVVGATELWTLGLPTVFTRRGEGELVVVDRGRRLQWFDADLQAVRTEDCPACRVVALQELVRPEKARRAAWSPTARPRRVAVVSPDGEDLAVRWPGASDEKPKEAPTDSRIAGAAAHDWRARTGPWGTVLVAWDDAGQVAAVAPGREAPTFTWTAPEGTLRAGEHVVADALGPWVRLRVVTGQGGEERTRLAGLVDPVTGTATDLVAVEGLDPALAGALGNPWHVSTFADATVLRVNGDPEMARMAPGDAVATFERCQVSLP